MKEYTATNLKVDGTKITLDVDGKTLTADFAEWGEIIKKIGGEANVSKAKLISEDLLEFPNDVHVEVEDFVELAQQQNTPVSAKLHKALA